MASGFKLNGGMRGFVKAVGAFACVFTFIHLPIILIVILSREYTMSYSTLEHSKNIVYSKALSEDELAFKFHRFEHLKPVVSACGNSRSLQFVQSHFSADFYSLSGGIYDVYALKKLVNNLNNNELKFLFVSLEPAWFCKNNKIMNLELEYPSRVSRLNTILGNYLKIWNYWLVKDKVSLTGAYDHYLNTDTTFVGLAASSDRGHRSDGSYDYGYKISKGDYELAIQEYVLNVKKGRGATLVHGDFSEVYFFVFNEFLEIAAKKGITIVGFVPPTDDRLVDEINLYPELFTYRAAFFDKVPELFNDYDHEFHDFHRFSLVGSSEKQAVDPNHGYEVMYAEMLLKMMESNSAISSVCKRSKLKELIFKSENGVSFVK